MGVVKVIVNGTTKVDITPTTATASDVASTKIFFNRNGEQTVGTGSGGSATLITKTITVNGTYNASSDNADGYSSVTASVPNAFTITDTSNTTGTTAVITAGTGGGGATQHTIHLEFDDSTDTDIEVDYDDSWVSSLITSTKPQTYGLKTIDSAALDNTVWYERQIIPLNTELVDYTQCTANYAIGQDGEAFPQEWSYASDYIAVDPSMTFSYTNSYWFYIGVYDDEKNVVRSIYVMTDGTQDPNDGNTGHGTLSGNKLLGASFVRLCGSSNSSAYMSLIRTA